VIAAGLVVAAIAVAATVLRPDRRPEPEAAPAAADPELVGTEA